MRSIKIIISVILVAAALASCAGGQSRDTISNQKKMSWKKLTPDEERVIVHKGTEAPFTGKYEHFDKTGTYVCRRCGTPLYRSADKFDARCGWPAFDDEIPGAVKRLPDADGLRTRLSAPPAMRTWAIFSLAKASRKITPVIVSTPFRSTSYRRGRLLLQIPPYLPEAVSGGLNTI